MKDQIRSAAKSRSRLAGALALSLFFHLGLAAWAGGKLAFERPRLLRMDVDLMLLEPAMPSPPAPEPSSLSRPAERKPEKISPVKPKTEEPEKPEVEPAPEPAPLARNSLASPEDEQPLAPPSLGGSSNPGPVSQSQLLSYQRTIHQRIYQAKRYPRESLLEREEGTVEVRFVISSSGSVSGVRVVKSSGFPLLDQAAMEAITRAAPFPAFPSGLDRSSFPITVPIQFALK